MNSPKSNEALSALSPDRFLLWWFDHAQEHGLVEKYRAYYSHYYDARENIPYVWKHFAYRMRHLAALNLRNKKLLDIGCGLGTEIFWAALRGAVARGIELHKDSLEVARTRAQILRRHADVDVELYDKNMLDLDEKYDIIFLRETFHHLEPREGIVKKLAELLHPDGVLIIEETNGLNPVIQLKYWLVRGRRVVVTKVREDGVSYLFGNERITTHMTLDRMFEKYGIRGEAEYFRLLPTSVAEHNSVAKCFESLENRFHNRIWLRPFYLHYSWIGRATK